MSFEKFEDACERIYDKIELAEAEFSEAIHNITEATMASSEVYREASENFLINASKTHANIKKVLETFLRDVNVKYSTYAATKDTKTVIKDIEDFSLMYGLSGAGDLMAKKKQEIDDLLDKFIADTDKLCKKYIENMNAEQADESRDDLNDLWDKYYDEFMDMNEDFDEEAEKMKVNQNTIDEVAKEISEFTNYTKKLNARAVKEIDDLYKMIQSSDNRYFVSLCSKASNQISLFVQKLTVYYVKYPFKVVVVLRRKLRGIKKEQENDD